MAVLRMGDRQPAAAADGHGAAGAAAQPQPQPQPASAGVAPAMQAAPAAQPAAPGGAAPQAGAIPAMGPAAAAQPQVHGGGAQPAVAAVQARAGPAVVEPVAVPANLADAEAGHERLFAQFMEWKAAGDVAGGDGRRGRNRRRVRRAGAADDSRSPSRSRSPSPTSRLARWDFAGEVLQALEEAGGVSCHHFVSTVPFRDQRARNECLQWGMAIDAYLAMRVGRSLQPLPEDSRLLDLMCRRLVGVLKADEFGNWSLATATQRAGPTRMAGTELFTAMSKAANSFDRVQKAVAKVTPQSAAAQASATSARRTPRGKRGSGGGGKRQVPAAGDRAATGHTVAARK